MPVHWLGKCEKEWCGLGMRPSRNDLLSELTNRLHSWLTSTIDQFAVVEIPPSLRRRCLELLGILVDDFDITAGAYHDSPVVYSVYDGVWLSVPGDPTYWDVLSPDGGSCQVLPRAPIEYAAFNASAAAEAVWRALRAEYGPLHGDAHGDDQPA